MQKHGKKILGIAAFLAIVSFFWSILSLGNLGDIEDGDPILTPLRIINRDVMGLTIAIFLIVIYLWGRDSKK
ncbi:MAG: hypothetical protein AAB634_02025 [Patescibacteria group bacterium]